MLTLRKETKPLPLPRERLHSLMYVGNIAYRKQFAQCEFLQEGAFPWTEGKAYSSQHLSSSLGLPHHQCLLQKQLLSSLRAGDIWGDELGSGEVRSVGVLRPHFMEFLAIGILWETRLCPPRTAPGATQRKCGTRKDPWGHVSNNVPDSHYHPPGPH